jgi:hypothetical protein
MITEAQKEAQELFDKFNKEGLYQISSVINKTIRKEMIKQCAIITVDEILKVLESELLELFLNARDCPINKKYTLYYEEVKKEIEKL